MILSVGKLGSLMVDVVTVGTLNTSGSVCWSFFIAFAINLLTLPAVFIANRLD